MKWSVTLDKEEVEVEADNHATARYRGAQYLIGKYNFDMDPEYLGKLLRAYQVNGRREYSSVPDLTNVPEEEKQWLTGFLEGDGCIQLQQGRPSIEFGQTDSRILSYIQQLVKGGKLYSGKPPRLVFSGTERGLPVLDAIKRYVVSRHYLEEIEDVFKLEAESHFPTLPWVVGFWDAEGCFSTNSVNRLAAVLSQRDKEPLEKVRVLLGGTVRWRQSSGIHQLFLRLEETKRFLPTYLKFSHNPEKRERLLASLYYLAKTYSAWRNYYERLGDLRKV